MYKNFPFYLSNCFIIVFYSELLWSINFQQDSLTHLTKSNSDTTEQFSIDDYDNLNSLYLHNFFRNDLSDSLQFLLQLDMLREKEKSSDFFQNTLSNQWKINDQLMNYFQFQRKIKLKSQLGVFGKVLGYSKNITAVILAILHVIKYKKRVY